MISILLPAYNGEKYIAEQIESLLSQTNQDFIVYIRDDRSSDKTYSIVKEYAEKNPGKIVVSRNEKNTGESKINYMEMMTEHKNDYVMLCDQDDVWLPRKIENSLNKIKELENMHGPATPIMVYTDLKVVNKNLEITASSYEKMADKNFDNNTLNSAITMNNAAGCTTIYNRALADLIQAVPEFYVMHDWWIYLLACAFGFTGVFKKPTILYRQHEDNFSGAKKVLSIKYIKYVLSNLSKMSSMINDSYRQSGAFLKMYKNKLTGEQSEMLYSYASLSKGLYIATFPLSLVLLILKLEKVIFSILSCFLYLSFFPI